MSKTEVVVISGLVIILVGLFMIESEKKGQEEARNIQLPNGVDVYRHDEENEVCFYTRYRIINCQTK